MYFEVILYMKCQYKYPNDRLLILRFVVTSLTVFPLQKRRIFDFVECFNMTGLSLSGPTTAHFNLSIRTVGLWPDTLLCSHPKIFSTYLTIFNIINQKVKEIIS